MGVVQVAPVQDDVHVHVLGAEQVAPFWQAEVQTGVAQVAPVHPVAQVHVFGAEQVPPC